MHARCGGNGLVWQRCDHGQVDPLSLVAVVGQVGLGNGVRGIDAEAQERRVQTAKSRRRLAWRPRQLHGDLAGGRRQAVQAGEVQSLQDRVAAIDDAVAGQPQLHVKRPGIACALIAQDVIDGDGLSPVRFRCGDRKRRGRQVRRCVNYKIGGRRRLAADNRDRLLGERRRRLPQRRRYRDA